MTIDTSSYSSHRARPSQPSPPPPSRSPSPGIPLDPALATTPNPLTLPPNERIQILDLHTHNPIISYNSRIYSCSWGSTIGTSLYLTDTPSSQDLKQLKECGIIGTSCITLTAKPVTVTPKDNMKRPYGNAKETMGIHAAQTSAPAASEQDTDMNTGDKEGQNGKGSKPGKQQPQPQIHLDDSAPHHRKQQADFLNTLMSIKAKKGETDRVPVVVSAKHTNYGWRAQRRQDRLEQAEESEGDDGSSSSSDDGQGKGIEGEGEAGEENEIQAVEERAPPAKSRRGAPRKRGVRLGRGRGGLFRDYQPTMGDQMGAELRWNGNGRGDGNHRGNEPMGMVRGRDDDSDEDLVMEDVD